MREQSQSVVQRLYSERPMFSAGRWALAEPFAIWLADAVAPGDETLETGAGYSTAIFAAAGVRHTCISPSEEEHARIAAWCHANDVPTSRLTFVAGRSQDVLPRLPLQRLDCVLIDGWHAFPVPILDWYHTAPALRVGGLMILDDDNIRTIRVLHDFLAAEHGRWERVTRIGHTSVFRKLVADVVDTGEWSTQPFNARKLLSPRERVRKAAYDVRSRLRSRVHGRAPS